MVRRAHLRPVSGVRVRFDSRFLRIPGAEYKNLLQWKRFEAFQRDRRLTQGPKTTHSDDGSDSGSRLWHTSSASYVAATYTFSLWLCNNCGVSHLWRFSSDSDRLVTWYSVTFEQLVMNADWLRRQYDTIKRHSIPFGEKDEPMLLKPSTGPRSGSYVYTGSFY